MNIKELIKSGALLLRALALRMALAKARKYIKKSFFLMDKDKNGEVSYEEFEESAEELHAYTSELLSKIFSK